MSSNENPTPMRATSVSIKRWFAVLALAAATVGCAAPGGGGWADFKSRRQIDAIAADDSFPDAAEVGLATTDTATK